MLSVTQDCSDYTGEPFADRLAEAVRTKGNALCVGLDPRWDALPDTPTAATYDCPEVKATPAGIAMLVAPGTTVCHSTGLPPDCAIAGSST